MRSLHLLHLGPGKVGKAFLHFLYQQQKYFESVFKVKVIVYAIVKSDGYVFNKKGLHLGEIKNALLSQEDRLWQRPVDDKIIRTLIDLLPRPSVLVDSTASENTDELFLYQLRRGGFVITSNKKPLTIDYSKFKQYGRFWQKFYFETTVGAGLPVISTIKDLLDSGDTILEIRGCFSGTLGFIFSQLENYISFSEAVFAAKKNGYTEPDPRDDLSGLDVARKALILSRLIGQKNSLADIKLQSLYPTKLQKLSIDNFLLKISSLDRFYKKKLNAAIKKENTLRYVANITPVKTEVSITEVPLSSDIGSLKGPENIIVVRTKRYSRNPLVIKGPGAGAQVTAAGVLVDLLKIIKIISGV